MSEAEVEAVARAMCQERAAYYGDPPCWKFASAWPNPVCDSPNCHALARAAIAALDAARGTDLAAREAAAAEAMKAACIEAAERHGEGIDYSVNPWGSDACDEVAAAIRALPLPGADALAAVRAEARREAMEIVERIENRETAHETQAEAERHMLSAHYHASRAQVLREARAAIRAAASEPQP